VNSIENDNIKNEKCQEQVGIKLNKYNTKQNTGHCCFKFTELRSANYLKVLSYGPLLPRLSGWAQTAAMVT
jgi:hypothetical protein